MFLNGSALLKMVDVFPKGFPMIIIFHSKVKHESNFLIRSDLKILCEKVKELLLEESNV